MAINVLFGMKKVHHQFVIVGQCVLAHGFAHGNHFSLEYNQMIKNERTKGKKAKQKQTRRMNERIT